jgi:hypothetical protein
MVLCSRRMIGVGWRELMAVLAVGFTHIGISALCDPIPVVVAQRTKEKVVRIAAGRIVAVVADAHSLGDRPLRNFISNPMGQQRPAAIHPQAAVSSHIRASGPLPTPRRRNLEPVAERQGVYHAAHPNMWPTCS